ncbi:MAG: DNA polymerase III subunit delta [Psychromonas sp.]|nr:DNA polymerase III subunit delta [Psychromonas sp.]
MKIFPDKLADSLSNSIPSCVLVFGDEALLSIEAMDQILMVAKFNGYLEKFEFDLNSHIEKEEIIYHFNSLSLFLEKKILILSLTKTNSNNTTFIREITPLLHPDILLIIKGPYLNQQQLKSVWFSDLEKQAIFVPVNPPFNNQFPSWIRSRLHRLDLIASDEVIEYLCVHFEGNLLAAKQEFEKLALLYPKQHLNLQQIEKSITTHHRFSVFQWVDSLLAGKKDRATRILKQLKSEGIALILISGSLNVEVKRLLKLSYQSHSTQLQTILNNQTRKLWPAKQRLITQALSRLTTKDLENLIQDCAEMEVALKVENNEDHWLKLSAIAYLFF